MIKFIKGLSLALFVFNSYAQCPEFTDDQENALALAYTIGSKNDLGYTTAAITWQESFWGDDIIRVNPSDGNLGSYGVMHMQLSTAKWLLNVKSKRATEDLMLQLIHDDMSAISLSHSYLSKHVDELGWRQGIRRYNGSGEQAEEYMGNIVEKVEILQDCGLTVGFNW